MDDWKSAQAEHCDKWVFQKYFLPRKTLLMAAWDRNCSFSYRNTFMCSLEPMVPIEPMEPRVPMEPMVPMDPMEPLKEKKS